MENSEEYKLYTGMGFKGEHVLLALDCCYSPDTIIELLAKLQSEESSNPPNSIQVINQDYPKPSNSVNKQDSPSPSVLVLSIKKDSEKTESLEEEKDEIYTTSTNPIISNPDEEHKSQDTERKIESENQNNDEKINETSAGLKSENKPKKDQKNNEKINKSSAGHKSENKPKKDQKNMGLKIFSLDSSFRQSDKPISKSAVLLSQSMRSLISGFEVLKINELYSEKNSNCHHRYRTGMDEKKKLDNKMMRSQI